MKLTTAFVALLSLLNTGALAAIYNDPSQLPRGVKYDFVVVGAGTSGNVIANRLSENQKWRVLVIDAGRFHEGFQDELIQIPFFGPQASPGTSFDWNYTTIPQQAINNQNIPYPRGYVLGGSSSTSALCLFINRKFFSRGSLTPDYMVYTRCSKNEYDAFANVAGDERWNWNNILPYAFKNEKHVPPNDGHNETGQYIPEIHGYDGPLLTSLPGFSTDIDERVLAVTRENPEFPYNPDYNSGDPLGISWMHSTVGGPLRSSSATAYLMPAVNSRNNIDLLYNAQVTRLIQSGRAGSVPIFRGVEFARGSRSKHYTVTATKEVVLSAGAIGTPQILLLSGIGPKDELSQLGIKTIVDSPQVGKNLVDHPILPIQWTANSNNTFDSINRGGIALDDALKDYYTTGKGRLAANGVSNHMAFFRLPENSSLLATGDPSVGGTAPHFELAIANGFFSTSQPTPATGSYFSIINVVVSPTSQGTVTLASNDPFAHPIIDPKLLDTEFDRQTMLYSLRASQRFAASQAFSDYITGNFTSLVTDEEVFAYMAQQGTTIKHPFCTARMNQDPSQGVVDGKLLVHNVRGLRIIDASIWPHIPGGHPQIPIYIIAERAADVIKESWA